MKKLIYKMTINQIMLMSKKINNHAHDSVSS